MEWKYHSECRAILFLPPKDGYNREVEVIIHHFNSLYVATRKPIFGGSEQNCWAQGDDTMAQLIRLYDKLGLSKAEQRAIDHTVIDQLVAYARFLH